MLMTDYHCKTNLSVLRELLQMLIELIINWVIPTILLPILIYIQGHIMFKIDILIFFMRRIGMQTNILYQAPNITSLSPVTLSFSYSFFEM